MWKKFLLSKVKEDYLFTVLNLKKDVEVKEGTESDTKEVEVVTSSERFEEKSVFYLVNVSSA